VSRQASKRTVFVFCVLELAGIFTRSALAQQSDHLPASSSDLAQLSEIVVTGGEARIHRAKHPHQFDRGFGSGYSISRRERFGEPADDSSVRFDPHERARTLEMRGMSSTGGNSATVGFIRG
jgi:hypothetical protein